MSDPIECKIVWMWCGWLRDMHGELLMWQRLESFTKLRCISPLALRWWRPWECFNRIDAIDAVDNKSTGRYRKLLAVLKQLESEIKRGCTSSFHAATERFAMNSEGAWLKVAGGEKAEVIESFARVAPVGCGSLALEFGAFIGYTSARLAVTMQKCFGSSALPRETCVVTIESDPIHVAVARHFIDLVQVGTLVEVQPGMVRDVVPLISEVFGGFALGVVFMDQKGTTFHIDHALLDSLAARPVGAGIISDNVVRPGAPDYVWAISHASLIQSHVFWSVPEFLEECFGVEDWMALQVLTQE